MPNNLYSINGKGRKNTQLYFPPGPCNKQSTKYDKSNVNPICTFRCIRTCIKPIKPCNAEKCHYSSKCRQTPACILILFLFNSPPAVWTNFSVVDNVLPAVLAIWHIFYNLFCLQINPVDMSAVTRPQPRVLRFAYWDHYQTQEWTP